jgi:peptidoglycan/xylan/chitin deacetylase (PgdA/CDA1 family)
MHAEPNLYDYWPYKDRPKIVWPGGKKLAFWIAPNIEYYEYDPPKNASRPGWPKPAPEVVGYSQRDWGNRVGHWRLMELLDKYGMRGSISLSVGLLAHHPEIVEGCVERNWEFFSHGIYNTRFSYNMDEAQERAVIEDSIRSHSRLSGAGPDPYRTHPGPDRRIRLLVHLRSVPGRPAPADQDQDRQDDVDALFAGGQRRDHLRRGHEPLALRRPAEAPLRPVAGRG